ncbi:MAG: nucleotidyltransferase domain-containing protein [Sulfolobales archaeon]
MSRSVLEGLGIPSRVREALEELITRLEAFLGEDYRLYLFGSYARGDWVEGLSDVDIIVVSPRFHGIHFVERAAIVRRLARDDISFEILCYTPEEFDQLLRSSMFMEEASRYWIQLH